MARRGASGRTGGARSLSEVSPIIPSTPGEPQGFATLGLRPELTATLATLGHHVPTPIQREAIPVLARGRDVLGQAATGTGKTAAFALPILERIEPRRRGAPVALVLVPTRELAMQVTRAFCEYGRDLEVRCVAVFGGQPIRAQIDALARGCHVVVATPGRALDHIRRGTIRLDGLRTVVLDEADEMLDLGFAEDLDAILDALPVERQTALFSATMAPRIETIAKTRLVDPERIRIEARGPAPGEAPRVREALYIVPRTYREAALVRVLRMERPGAAIVFCPTRRDVDSLAETLPSRGFRSEALHGGMDQAQRDRVMSRFRAGAVDLLLATDVAARGLDIDHLTHVVNLGLPAAAESYVHRTGRVGRAGREGVAITLADPAERRQLRFIERLIGRAVPVARLPSASDLSARRTAVILDQIRDVATGSDPAPDPERLRTAVEALTAQHDPMEIALAAVSMMLARDGSDGDDVEIPDLSQRARRGRVDQPHGEPRGRGGAGRGGKHGRDDGRRAGRGTARLYVAAGHQAGVRARDLVGAIAGESSLRGTDIGSIEVKSHFSLVEVPAADLDDVVRAMARATIKGRKAKVRRFVEDAAGRPGSRARPHKPRRAPRGTHARSA